MQIQKNFLIDRILEDPDNSDKLLIKEGGMVYCQFDLISIEKRSEFIAVVTFYWKNKIVNVLTVESSLNTVGSALKLTNFIGKILIDQGTSSNSFFESIIETPVTLENSFWTCKDFPTEKGWYPVKVCIDLESIPSSAFWDGIEWSKNYVIAYGERCTSSYVAKDLANENC